MTSLGPSESLEKEECGPTKSPSPGPTFPIEEAAPERLVIKSKPIADKTQDNATKQKQYNVMNVYT